MSAPRVIRAAYSSRVFALLNGYGSRELLEEVGAKPMWLPRYRAWTSTAKHVSDALALAQANGWHTAVIEREHMLMAAGAELAEERGVLW